MADENNKVVKLEERLANAAAKFKEMQTQLDAKNDENEKLKIRVSELEDELTLNGGAKEEVEGLKTRLEKAKEIFATQKAKIADMTEVNSNIMKQVNKLESTNGDLKEQVSQLEEENVSLNEKLRAIVEIVNG